MTFNVTGLALRYYFVRCELTEVVYSKNVDRGVPGGILGFVKFSHAKGLADRLSLGESTWTVIEASEKQALEFCFSHNYTLWIQQEDGTHTYDARTITGQPRILKKLTPVEEQLAKGQNVKGI